MKAKRPTGRRRRMGAYGLMSQPSERTEDTMQDKRAYVGSIVEVLPAQTMDGPRRDESTGRTYTVVEDCGADLGLDYVGAKPRHITGEDPECWISRRRCRVLNPRSI